MFSRNRGLISEQEQHLLAQTCILIAGVGGDGGLLAERLARFGIGKLILADPEVFDIANINRQYAANSNTIGKNKAISVSAQLLLINPKMEIQVYTDGITIDNVHEMVLQADIVVDEIEYSLPGVSVILHRQARAQNKYVFMGANIGWGASIFCFAPGGKTFEEHFCYNAANKTIDPLAYLNNIPLYFDEDVVAGVLAGVMPMPAVASSVSLVASVLANEVIFLITGKREPIVLPQYLFIDLFDLTISKS